MILNYAQFALNDMGKFTRMMRKLILSRLCMLIADVLYYRQKQLNLVLQQKNKKTERIIGWPIKEYFLTIIFLKRSYTS